MLRLEEWLEELTRGGKKYNINLTFPVNYKCIKSIISLPSSPSIVLLYMKNTRKYIHVYR